MTRYNPKSVNAQIAAENRKTPDWISDAEATQIHRILSGRCGKALEVTQIVEIPAAVPGDKAPMSKQRFVQGLARLGYNVSTANQLLGMGRSTIYRMSKGTSEVPEVVKRLLDMYEKHGIPEEHK